MGTVLTGVIDPAIQVVLDYGGLGIALLVLIGTLGVLTYFGSKVLLSVHGDFMAGQKELVKAFREDNLTLRKRVDDMDLKLYNCDKERDELRKEVALLRYRLETMEGERNAKKRAGDR